MIIPVVPFQGFVAWRIQQRRALGQHITAGYLQNVSPQLSDLCAQKSEREGIHRNASLYRLLYGNILCKTCGSSVKPNSKHDWSGEHHRYCSPTCAQVDPKTRQKCEATMLANHGFTHTAKSPALRRKMARTLRSNYGVSTPFASAEIQRRAKATLWENYGVEHGLQNRGILERQQKAGFKVRELSVDGHTFRLRGYEPEAVQWLVEQGCEPRQILHTAAEGVPSIPYTHQGEKRVYHPDFYVRWRRRWTLIEVKSTWTCGLRNDKTGVFSRVRRKAAACVAAGYPFLLCVVYKSGEVALIKNVHQMSRRQVVQKLRLLHPAVEI